MRDVDLENAVQQFLIDQELKGNTKKTVAYYQSNLAYFLDFAGHEKTVSDLSVEDLKKYFFEIRKRPRFYNNPIKPKVDKPLSSVTVQTYMRSVRVFCRWLYGEGYILEDLGSKFKLPKATKKTVEILSDEEIETLLKCMKTTTEMGLRKCLCFNVGLRLTYE